MSALHLEVGEPVWLRIEGRTVAATVAVVSENQRSLAFSFEALLAGWAGNMPVLDRTGEGDYRDLAGNRIQISKRVNHHDRDADD